MTDIKDIFENMEYGPALEDGNVAHDWLRDHEGSFGHWIAGRWTTPRRDFKSINPADSTLLAELSQSTTEDVDRAIQAARSSLREWQALTGDQRGRHLYAIARHVQKHARLFSVLETLDNGKPIRESRDIDIPFSYSAFLSPCWVGIVGRRRVDSKPAHRCRWPDNSLELSIADARLEGCTSACSG